MLDNERIEKLNNFCKRLDIKFKDLELLNLAFRHKSYNDDSVSVDKKNNERLEFLGDSVLEISAAYYLYKNLIESEGNLAKIKSAAVSEETLSKIATKYKFNDMLLLGQGEELSNGRNKKTILADCVESVFGAYFLDAGFDNALKLIEKLIAPEIELIRHDKGFIDYKTELQEYCQKILHKVPKYEVIDKKGPDHDITYTVKVHIIDKIYGPGKGKSKKQAEHNCAKVTLNQIKMENKYDKRKL